MSLLHRPQIIVHILLPRQKLVVDLVRVKLLTYHIDLLGEVHHAFVVFIVFANYLLSHVFERIVYECEVFFHLTFFL